VGLAACLYLRATTLAAAGRLQDAREVSRAGLVASERAGEMWARGLLNAVLGSVEWQLGNLRAAEERLKQAVRIQDLTRHRWGLLTSLEELALAAGAAGQHERAALLLGTGAALAEEIGVLLLDLQARHDACEAAARAGLGEARYRELWERGYGLGRGQVVALALEDEGRADARPVTVAGAHSDGVELSAREFEVARLVAAGLSNPAIAAELFVSLSTVKTHLTHILQKLGLDSRAQIGVRLAEDERPVSDTAR
jgi:DNA-binding CsgD family transcriptional regulator